ncbi:vanadium-dependent haloperoxidase [Streptomyces sp. ME02-8801-2C]|uniref:vanadium-dependent haloperoxidase n=1 Tax=Streptomyces sp. ME02-8801-2C TaxID=3028680 RepID=UPI0029BD9832|nr:vanadium-dependent haloperoxidase [Streptomyces sp. ME02-8801-2C]MDX3455641.1 vanadium-dependent haloperoxidase [Streptomyces sp. ME02-8801-2C]
MTTSTRSVRRSTAVWRRGLATAAVLAATGSALTVAPQPAHAALPQQQIADPVHYWNDVLLQVIRREGGGPGPMARSAAMLNAAIYDAESSYQLKWKGKITSEPYIHAQKYDGWIEGPDEEERVIGRTAYNILVGLYGRNQAQFLDAKFRERFGTEPTGLDLLDLTVVNRMVTQMRDARNGDGSDNDQVYVGDNKPGAWRPTSYPDMPDPSCERDSQAVTPFWGQVKPFALTSGSQFRPANPGLYGTYEKLLASDAYKAQVEAVRSAGADKPTARTPVVNRTPEQEAAAWFWANDEDGTYKPPGQLLQATREVSQARGLNTYENARLFALVSIAMADAGIAVRDVKFLTPIDLWRPVSAIREGGLDPEWKPLLKTRAGVNVTPCFPAWASGHATFGAAWAGVMKRYFGSDNIAFDMTTDEPQSPVKTRHFTSFSTAATEDAYSRVWLGVHFPWDAEDGLTLGDKIAAQVYTTKLRKL